MSEIAKSMRKKNPIDKEFIVSTMLDTDFFHIKNFQENHVRLEKYILGLQPEQNKKERVRAIIFKCKLYYAASKLNDELKSQLTDAIEILEKENDWIFYFSAMTISLTLLLMEGKNEAVKEKLLSLEQILNSQPIGQEVENEFYYIKSVFHDIMGEYEIGALIAYQRIEICKDSENKIVEKQIQFFKVVLSSIFFKLGMYREALSLSTQVFRFSQNNVNSRLFIVTLDTIPLCLLFLKRFLFCKNFILSMNEKIRKIGSRRSKRFRQSMLNRCYVELGEEEKCIKVPRLLKNEILSKFDHLELVIDNISFDFRKKPQKKYLKAMLAIEESIQLAPANSKLSYYRGLLVIIEKLKIYPLYYEIYKKMQVIEEKVNTDKARNMTIGHRIKNETEALKQKMKAAEEKSKIKHEFLMGISHDLRSPLAAVISATSLLDNDSLSEETKKSYAQTAKKSAAGLIDMIDELLEVSSIESRAVKVNKKKINLQDFFGYVIESQQLIAAEKSIPLVLNLDSLNLIEINSDSHLLNRILSNLLANAIKYTEHGMILLSARNDSQFLYIEVVDSGIGIAEDKLKDIFDLYTKSGEESHKRKDSHGLGLFIVKNLVSSLGGKIGVQSQLGMGSTFTISLPLSVSV